MRMYVPMALALALGAWAQTPSKPTSDPVLDSLLQEAMARSPDLAKAQEAIAADKERIPQARALPDPTLTLGIQNDGFKKIEVGEMETSYYQVMLTQPFYWPGKRDLKADVARAGAEGSEAGLARERLSLVADVKRAYYGLLLVRGQKQLLELQAPLLEQAEAIAKTRYEVGQGSQADLLRAQLARTRLLQTRLSLDAQERITLANLNRLRAAEPEASIATTQVLSDVPDPLPIHEAPETALEESPEVAAARAGLKQAERSLDLAKLNRHPDFSVSAGIMPRGKLDPMWTLNVGISLPLWSRNKQQRAVAEQELRRQAQGSQVEGLGHLLKARMHERAAEMDAALGLLNIYHDGLLVQSEGTFRANLAQYQTGKAPFSAVLESLSGWIADQSGWLQAKAQAQAIAIAQDERALGPTAPIGATGLSAPAMGTSSSGTATGPARPGTAPASESNSTSMTSM